jgi:hypothetical protein
MKLSISIAALLAAAILAGQTRSPFDEFKIFAGSTHAHTAYTWSHGEQFVKGDCAGIVVYNKDPNSPTHGWSDGYVKTKEAGCPGIFVIDSFQYPSNSMKVRADWQEVQGPPARHFALAKANGYDFYTVTDHSQEAAFQPASPDNPLWIAARTQAEQATDAKFVAIPGFEFSENDGPGGKGHINVMNSEGMLNALAPGVDLPHFYKWLAAAKSNGDGPVVASFNHPGPDQYADWADRDPQVTDIITMLEVINSNNKIHYPGFVKALDKGWKVSPVCGNDNHGLTGITKQKSRTFVLARTRTKAEVLDAMKNRRTYASLDGNLQCKYTVNGAIMGSTLKPSGTFQFDIRISDPDTSSAGDKITKIDIVKDGGAVVQHYEPAPGYSVHWTPTVQDATAHYFFIRVWTAGGGDAPGAKPENPVAWLAPVWVSR